MKVGVHLGYQNLRGESDMEFFRRETQLMVEAEAMGFDFAACVEHHFTDYAACPDPVQALSYVAAKTKTIKLMPAAIILPWNDPLRVVEKMAMLDSLSEGRAVLGMGRGAARREFKSFGRDLADSREIFDEAAMIILDGLETGVVKADGKWFQIPETEIRPRPEGWSRDRAVMVSMSPSSAEVAADYGLKALRFSQGDWSKALPEINNYRDTFKAKHGKAAPPFVISDFMVCFDDKDKVTEYTDKYFAAQFLQVANHYEFMSDHFKSLPSYATYAYMGEAAEARGGAHNAYKDYIGGNLIGTPEELYEKHLQRKAMVGDYEIIANFSFGGMPYEDVYEQMKTFADKVMPKLKEEEPVMA
ncbi:flavin-dependent oxidoreductase [Novosphingobium indicum]|uniref:Flavin-dependent oxidoreductase n=1 Tax=Novosphingobium indicum TaxID=462949 RepID=A0ABQ2JTR4_9SPHN|nr:LLM class flavin-dependent oxidoreductase [Novosphingobium indicum]GGN57111.1 flavin-dependent oxidoreductase [Novosphingobium indicum]